MPSWGETLDFGSDYAIQENALGRVFVIFGSNRDELNDQNALDQAGTVLDTYVTGLGMLSSAQVTGEAPEFVNEGYLVRYEGATADGSPVAGLLYLRQGTGMRFNVILISGNVEAAEPDFRTLAEGFLPNPGGEAANQAEADSGFRPEDYGFGFPNYGGNLQVMNLTPVEMQRMFGEVVCASTAGGECTLTPPAKRWMDQVNDSMNGGHCEGMAVLSSLMYYGQVDPNAFGAQYPNDLSLEENDALQRELAYWFATQYTTPGGQNKINESPTAVVQALIEAFAAGSNAGEYYSVGVYKREFKGGHAVTPVAVDDKGDGLYDILVYDNNIPNNLRVISVDANTNTWRYEASINPSEQADLYEGDADSHTLEIVSITPRLQQQVCDFCSGSGMSMRGGRGQAQAAPEYFEVWLEGAANLLISDEQGRSIGYKDGEYVNDMPGAETQHAKLGLDVWDEDYEPVYRIPVGSTFIITVDGSELEEVASSSVSVIGPGFFLAVDEIPLEPGDSDQIVITSSGNTYGILYASTYVESPEIYLGLETEAADYAFLVKGVELPDVEDTLNIFIDLDNQALVLSGTGNPNAGTYNLYALRIDENGESAFGTEGFVLQPESDAYLLYNEWPGDGSPMTIWIDTNGDGVADETLELPDTTSEFEW